MADRSGYAKCPICYKERQTTATGRMINHRKWTGVRMVHCEGSMMKPAKR
jgi:hypothetical protein